MNLLMITPVVDPEDDLLGFVYGWVEELSKRVDRLNVMTWKKGKATLPSNVEIYVIEGTNKLSRVINFEKTLFSLLRKESIDVIFTHMYPEFALLSVPLAKLRGKSLIMFYAHGKVGIPLRIAHIFADKILTSSPEGCRIKSSKVIVLSQGVDVERFKPGKKGDYLLTVSRVSRVKRHEVVINALKELCDVRLVIVGPVTDEKYSSELKALVSELGLNERVEFAGAVPHSQIDDYLSNCLLFISASETGSLDKTTLEAMACKKPVLVCNEAFREVLKGYNKHCLFMKGDSDDLAKKINSLLKDESLMKRIGPELRKRVIEKHSKRILIEKMINVFKKYVRT